MTAREARCPRALHELLPRDATRWVFARPRAMFEHPRFGRSLAHAFDDASERALITRSRRLGYDLRTVERALVAWSDRGTVAFGMSAFDTRRIADLMWERLLPPRRRGELPGGVTRVEGVLDRATVAVAVHGECGVAAYAEGDTRPVDRSIAEREAQADARDPEALLVWHQRGVPDEVRRATTDALLDRVRDTEVAADATDTGLRVRLRFEGDVPADGARRLRRALDALMVSPLGEAASAGAWLDESRVVIAQGASRIEVTGEVPWGALDALADAMRGRVGDGPMP